MEERDITEPEWNNYLKKYKDQYRVKKDLSDVWTIQCKFGNIQLYSMKEKKLCFVANFRSPRMLSSFLRKTEGLVCNNTQEGFDDVVLVFNEDDLPKFASICLVRKKRHVQMTDERKQQLREQLQRAREQKVR